MHLLNCFCDGCGNRGIGSGGAKDGDRWRKWGDGEPHWFQPPDRWLVLVSGRVPLLACSDPCAMKLSGGAKPIGAEAREQWQVAEMEKATRIGRAAAGSTKMKEQPRSAEEMNELAEAMPWEEQTRFLREHDCSLTMRPAEKGQWSVAVVCKGRELSSVQSGRREGAINAAVALAAESLGWAEKDSGDSNMRKVMVFNAPDLDRTPDEKRLHGEVWAYRFGDSWYYAWAVHPAGRTSFSGPFGSEVAALLDARRDYDVGGTE